MGASNLMADAAMAASALTAPGRGLSAVAERPRLALALTVATAASLAAAAVIVPRVDYGWGQLPSEAQQGQAWREPTEHEREEAASAARKLGQAAAWASAALAPSVLPVMAAGVLFLAFRVAGALPAFRPALAVAAHGMLPIWLGDLLRIPAAIAHAPVPSGEVQDLLPSSLAALLAPDAAPPWRALLSGLDLFALWAMALIALGMARASGASRARSAITTAVVFLACLALLRVVPAAGLPVGAGPSGSR
jgi:hypothetical protein